MKNRHKTKNLTIEIYDEDGELCESVGGPMDFEDVRAHMIDTLRNDGIPVIRSHEKKKAEHVTGEHVTGETSKPNPFFVQPMTLRIELDHKSFMAIGRYEDVMDAMAGFMEAIKEAE